MLTPGTLVDNRYRIKSLIGQGGLSRVYLAVNERTGKTWAIKELRDDTPAAGPARDNLQTEIRFLSGAQHPAIPSIVDVVDEGAGGRLLIVMEYIEGRSLAEVLKSGGPLAPRRALQIAIELTDILSWLHHQRPPVIYRDLKPGNVILRPDGHVSLIDFGSVRRVHRTAGTRGAANDSSENEDTVCLGTRGYAAPEQFGGLGQTDERTDIYGLGATLFTLLTGKNAAAYHVCRNGAGYADLPPQIDRVIRKCLMPDPGRRYPSCAALRRALQNALRKLSVIRLQCPAAVRSLLPAAAASLLCLTLTLTVVFLRPSVTPLSRAAAEEPAAPSVSKEDAPVLSETEALILLRADLKSVGEMQERLSGHHVSAREKAEMEDELHLIASRLEKQIIKNSAAGEISGPLQSEQVRTLSMELVRALQQTEALLNAS